MSTYVFELVYLTCYLMPLNKIMWKFHGKLSLCFALTHCNLTNFSSDKNYPEILISGEDVMNYLHQGIFNGERGVKCTLCGKFTKSLYNGRRHMILKHTKPTNDVCKYCSKVFKHKYYLDEHIRSRECLSTMLFDAPQ